MRKPRRGMLTVADLRANCIVDPSSHCWLWQGATTRGIPRIWTLDYARIEKRCMSGPLAAWHIAYGEPPRDGHLVFRACLVELCLNPAHLRQARNRAEIGAHIHLTGKRAGPEQSDKALAARKRNILCAQAASVVRPTPAPTVLAIKELIAQQLLTPKAIGAQVGVSESLVCAIRAGRRHAGVVA